MTNEEVWPANTPTPNKAPEVNIEQFGKTLTELSKNNGDPAPTPENVALERMTALVQSVTTSTLNELRELRDAIDNLMRSVQAQNDIQISSFVEHVHNASEAIKTKHIIKESIERLGFQIEVSKNVTVR